MAIRERFFNCLFSDVDWRGHAKLQAMFFCRLKN
jgi:hypothetical protein